MLHILVIERHSLIADIQAALQHSRIVAMIGPRQSGKTTLAQIYVPSDSLSYFDLEGPVGLIRMEEPMTALHELKVLVVIDEIQPLFLTLRKSPSSLHPVTKP